jgi:CheY-like chemotaxis protein
MSNVERGSPLATSIIGSEDPVPASAILSQGKNGSSQSSSGNAFRHRIDLSSRYDKGVIDSGTPAYRIIVIDDQPDIVAILKQGLKREGFDVVGYTDPTEALSNFAHHRFDVVLMDIRMPQMNGLELFRRMRAIDKDVLICFVTAYEYFRRRFESAYPEEQTSCFIPKPLKIDRLVATITQKMEERENSWRHLGG